MMTGVQGAPGIAGEFAISVVDEIALTQKKAIEVIRKLPGALLHEGGMRTHHLALLRLAMHTEMPNVRAITLPLLL